MGASSAPLSDGLGILSTGERRRGHVRNAYACGHETEFSQTIHKEARIPEALGALVGLEAADQAGIGSPEGSCGIGGAPAGARSGAPGLRRSRS